MLEINESGQHRYTPNPDGVSAVRTALLPFYELIDGQDWEQPILLWKNRIADAARFGEFDDISQHTDNYRLVRIHDELSQI